MKRVALGDEQERYTDYNTGMYAFQAIILRFAGQLQPQETRQPSRSGC